MKTKHGKGHGQGGLSLIEVIIGVAIFGVAVLLLSQLGDSVNHMAREASESNTQDSILKVVRKSIQRATGSVLWEDYNPATSFYRTPLRSPDLPSPINPSPRGNTPEFTLATGPGYRFVRDSHTLQIRNFEDRLNGATRGLLLSRCIPKEDVKKAFTIQEVRGLRRRPILMFQGETAIVSCCQYNEQNKQFACQNGEQTSSQSPFRSRVFLITQETGAVQMFPKAEEVKRSFGAGFMVMFDRASNPTVLTKGAFVLDNPCSLKDLGITPKDCQTPEQDRTKAHIGLNITSINPSVHESGAIDLGN